MIIARQAACVEILRQWIPEPSALQNVIRMQELFATEFVNVGELSRGIARHHTEIAKGRLFSRLSKVLHSMQLHLDYFRAQHYERTISLHCDAHRAFGRLMEVSLNSRTDEIPDAYLQSLPDLLVEETRVPEFVRTRLRDSTVSGHLVLPLYLSTGALRWILTEHYAQLCKSIGPVQADKAYSEALLEARRTSPHFDPASLL